MPIKRGGLRFLDEFTFTASARQSMALQVPARYLQHLWLWLRGTLTISAVTVPGDIHADGPANLIATVELLIDGKTHKIGSFPAFLRVAQRYFRTVGHNAGLGSSAAGVYTFEVLVPLSFEAVSTIRPIDTLLDGRPVKNATLNITWQGAGDLVVGETSTLAITATTCQVYLQDTEPFPEDAPFWVYREIETTHGGIVTSGASRLQISFTPKGIMRFIQLRAIDGADLSDAIINEIDALRVNGERPYSDLEDDFVQAFARYEYGIDIDPDGYYHLELVENGHVRTTGLGANNAPLKDVDVIADTTVGAGATSIVSHVGEHVPPDAI